MLNTGLGVFSLSAGTCIIHRNYLEPLKLSCLLQGCSRWGGKETRGERKGMQQRCSSGRRMGASGPGGKCMDSIDKELPYVKGQVQAVAGRVQKRKPLPALFLVRRKTVVWYGNQMPSNTQARAWPALLALCADWTESTHVPLPLTTGNPETYSR